MFLLMNRYFIFQEKKTIVSYITASLLNISLKAFMSSYIIYVFLQNIHIIVAKLNWQLMNEKHATLYPGSNTSLFYIKHITYNFSHEGYPQCIVKKILSIIWLPKNNFPPLTKRQPHLITSHCIFTFNHFALPCSIWRLPRDS